MTDRTTLQLPTGDSRGSVTSVDRSCAGLANGERQEYGSRAPRQIRTAPGSTKACSEMVHPGMNPSYCYGRLIPVSMRLEEGLYLNETLE